MAERKKKTVLVEVTVDWEAGSYEPDAVDAAMDLWGAVDATHDRELPGWGFVGMKGLERVEDYGTSTVGYGVGAETVRVVPT